MLHPLSGSSSCGTLWKSQQRRPRLGASPCPTWRSGFLTVWFFYNVQDAVDATKSAAHKVEHGAAAAGSAALATAAAGEERTGHVMKEAGKKLEADGAQAKRHYRGEQVKEDTKKKFGVCSIM